MHVASPVVSLTCTLKLYSPKNIVMAFESIVPILYSSDVKRSIEYYMNELCFDDSWTWDEPATFGGVSKDCVRLFFCLNGQGSPGTWVAINMENVDEYYEQIKAKGAKILSVPQDYDWFMREMLVEDPDGHKIRFGHGKE